MCDSLTLDEKSKMLRELCSHVERSSMTFQESDFCNETEGRLGWPYDFERRKERQIGLDNVVFIVSLVISFPEAWALFAPIALSEIIAAD